MSSTSSMHARMTRHEFLNVCWRRPNFALYFQFSKVTPELDVRIEGNEKNVEPVELGVILMFVTKAGKGAL